MKPERAIENGGPNGRQVIVAALSASVLMFALGLSHRVLAWRLAAPGTSATIAPDLLERLPMEIGDWVGKDVPLDEAIVRRTDTDTHVNRLYSRGGQSVSAYVACGTRIRELMVHRPEVCYVGAGWTLTGRHARELPLGDGTTLPCNIFEFSRGVLETTKTTVLYYYIVDGQYCRNLSDWQYHFWDIGYVAQVHVAASSQAQGVAADAETVSQFAVESTAQIMRLLDGIADNQEAGRSVRTPEEKQ
jgi:EpsI family protein